MKASLKVFEMSNGDIQRLFSNEDHLSRLQLKKHLILLLSQTNQTQDGKCTSSLARTKSKYSSGKCSSGMKAKTRKRLDRQNRNRKREQIIVDVELEENG